MPSSAMNLALFPFIAFCIFYFAVQSKKIHSLANTAFVSYCISLKYLPALTCMGCLNSA